MITPLSSSGVLLALRLLEAPNLEVVHDALFETFGAAGAELVEKRFWRKTGSANATTILDDDGQPANVEWDEFLQEFGYYGSAEGWTAIDPVRLSIYRPDLDQLLDDLLDRKLRKPAGGMFRVDDSGFAWEIGTLNLTRTKPTSVWFVRCLQDAEAVAEITMAAKARPSGALRLLLTSSIRSTANSVRIPSATIVSIADVLTTGPHPQIDMAILKSRFVGSPADPISEPVHLSDDGRLLTLVGEVEIRFRGQPQIAGIRFIVSEHKMGNRVRARDVLQAANTGADQLDKLFRGQWKTLSQYFKSQNGSWGFEL